MLRKNNRSRITQRKSKQKGLILIDVLLGGAAILIGLSIYAKWANEQSEQALAKSVKDRIEYIIDKTQLYYMARIVVDGNSPSNIANYPSSYTDLTDKSYIPVCSAADELSNLCVNYSLFPIGGGEAIKFAVTADADGYSQLELSLDLSKEKDTKRKNLFRQTLIGIPGFEMDANEIVTITVTRPGSALAFENVVLRDGSQDMTGDWDYGGTATLENVKDITIQDLPDRTLVTSMLKYGSVYITSQAGALVDKPTCPSGYTPTITTSFIGTGGTTEYTEMGNVDTYWTDYSTTQWSVNIRFAALKNGDTSRSWHYQGNVGYFTWCDL